MKLSDRLREQNRLNGHAITSPEKPVEWAPPRPTAPLDPVVALKASVQEALLGRLGLRLFDSTVSEEQLHTFVAQEISILMSSSTVPLRPEERQRLVDEIMDDVIGLGPVERFLADPTVSEVMVNSTDPIYVERPGVIERPPRASFRSSTYGGSSKGSSSQVGRRIDESSPMVDARLPDGSRVNAIIPPLAVDGPVLTIRKFSRDPLQRRRT